MQIQNSDVRQEIVDVSGFQQISNVLSIDDSKVIAVVDVNPSHNRKSLCKHSNIVASGTGATVYTIPASKDVYITGFTFSVVKDATCDTADGAVGLSFTPYNQATAIDLYKYGVLTLTAQNDTIAHQFPFPIRCKAGTTLRIESQTHTAGKMRLYASFQFIENEMH